MTTLDLYIGGEQIGHVEKFQISMIDVEKSEISRHSEEFQIFYTTDVEKSEMLPNFEEFQISPHDRHPFY